MPSQFNPVVVWGATGDSAQLLDIFDGLAALDNEQLLAVASGRVGHTYDVPPRINSQGRDPNVPLGEYPFVLHWLGQQGVTYETETMAPVGGRAGSIIWKYYHVQKFLAFGPTTGDRILLQTQNAHWEDDVELLYRRNQTLGVITARCTKITTNSAMYAAIPYPDKVLHLGWLFDLTIKGKYARQS